MGDEEDALPPDVGPGHAWVEHTADLALRVWAPDEAALLQEAARAVIGGLTDGAEVARTHTRTVELSALDPEDRLVVWINEVLWLATGEGFVLGDAQVQLDGEGLRATVRGEADAHARVVTEIKSATYHDLRLHRAADRVWARLVLDV